MKINYQVTLLILGLAVTLNTVSAQDTISTERDCKCATEPSKVAQNLANSRKIKFSRKKGFGLEEIKENFYIGTDGNTTFSLVVTKQGAIFIDAPVTIKDRIKQIAAEVTDNKISHIIYTHAHSDHIGGFADLEGSPIVIASKGAAEELTKVANEINPLHPFGTFVGGNGMVPLPTHIVDSKEIMEIDGIQMELNPLGEGHSRGDLTIYFPDMRIMVASDLTWPASVPWVRLGQAVNVMGLIAANRLLLDYDFDALIAGHASEVGTKHDVEMTVRYLEDLQKATIQALKENNPEQIAQNRQVYNGYELMDIYFNKVVCEAARTVKNKWMDKLQGVGIWSCEHAEKMMTALRMDHIKPEEFQGN